MCKEEDTTNTNACDECPFNPYRGESRAEYEVYTNGAVQSEEQ